MTGGDTTCLNPKTVADTFSKFAGGKSQKLRDEPDFGENVEETHT